MERKTLTFSDFGAEGYFYVSTFEVNANLYDIITSELKKIVKRHKKGKRGIVSWKEFSPYDVRRLQAAMRGTCYKCGKRHDDYTTTVTCKECANKIKEEGSKRVQRLRDERKCTVCGEPLLPECETTRCSACKWKASILRKARRYERKEKNLCVECGKAESLPSHNSCETCYFKQKAQAMFGTNKRWQEIQSLWEKQDGICPYTNKKLVRGKDASIDHKYPRARFPELMNDIDNLEWIDRQINTIKNNRTPREFIERLQSLINNYQSIVNSYNGNRE